MMNLDEAIKHAEEVADTCEYEASKYDVCDSYEKHVAYQEGKCAEEHRQLAEWLKELKELREKKRPHGECKTCKHFVKGGLDGKTYVCEHPNIEQDDYFNYAFLAMDENDFCSCYEGEKVMRNDQDIL